MLKKFSIKVSLIVIALGAGITLTYLRSDIFSTDSYKLSTAGKNINLEEIKSEATESTEIEETDSPVYFSVFKFINSFAPAK